MRNRAGGFGNVMSIACESVSIRQVLYFHHMLNYLRCSLVGHLMAAYGGALLRLDRGWRAFIASTPMLCKIYLEHDDVQLMLIACAA